MRIEVYEHPQGDFFMGVIVIECGFTDCRNTYNEESVEKAAKLKGEGYTEKCAIDLSAIDGLMRLK